MFAYICKRKHCQTKKNKIMDVNKYLTEESKILINKSYTNEELIPSIFKVEREKIKAVEELEEINSLIFKNGVHVNHFQKMKNYFQESLERYESYGKIMQDYAKQDRHKVEIYQKCIERVLQRYQRQSDKFNYKLSQL